MVTKAPRPRRAVLFDPFAEVSRSLRGVGVEVRRGTEPEDLSASECPDHDDPASEILACERSFPHFLRHWRFKNRETGDVLTFRHLWEGQEEAAAKMERHRWLILLKAGKLGFTELECAYDGWVARFRQRNARVHLFSMDQPASQSLLEMVKFGLTHLPEYMQLPIADDEPGGDTAKSLKLRAGPDDQREIVSYPATTSVAIDKTATHSHVDELARMKWPGKTWASIQSTIAPRGTVHIVSRGAGEQNELARLWRAAQQGGSAFHPHFAPYDKRPRYPTRCGTCRHEFHADDVCEAPPEGEIVGEACACTGMDQDAATRYWYAEQEATGMPTVELYYLAPRTPEEALTGDQEDQFVALALWDRCYEESLPELLPGDRTPVIISLDAGITSDLFAAAIISRHPERPAEAALRGYRVWHPPKNGEVDFLAVENWVRCLILGGCLNGHPNRTALRLPSQPPEGEECEMCERGERIPPLNVVQVTYDRFQLKDMAQSFERENIVWAFDFDQNALRLEADGQLRRLIVNGKFAHRIRPSDKDNDVRKAVAGAKAKVSTGEDTKLRIIKGTPDDRVDPLVAISMGVHQCLFLTVENLAG